MITWSTIEDALHLWAETESGLSAIWLEADANAPRPAKPYLGLRTNSLVQIGQDHIGAPDAITGIGKIRGNREFTLSVQHYGSDAIQTLETLRSSLQKLTVLATLGDSGIIFVDRLAITNLSGLIDSRFEERASMDLLFRTVQSITDDLGVIETLETTGVTFDADLSTITVDLITITTP